MQSRARAVTQGPYYHWFGYYDMPCWDASGRYLLTLAVPFERRSPAARDVARIELIDSECGDSRIIGQTRAFNWQQGAMLRWLPSAGQHSVVYNDRVRDRYVSVLLDPWHGEERVLGRALSDVGEGGRLGLSLNFARIAQTRPGYGYAGLPDPYGKEGHPAADGVFVVDMASGRSECVVSMDRAYRHLGAPRELEDAKIWFNHTLLNPSESRFVFLMRWRPEGRGTWRTYMFVADSDGENLTLLIDSGMVSHFDWRDDRHLLVWTRFEDEGDHFYLVDVETGAHEVVGADCLTEDGHCCYAHNRRWFLTDTYPHAPGLKRTLKIYLPQEKREVIVGRYLSPPPFVGELRCDLHPRWSPDDSMICFDSVHEGHRQLYVVPTPEGLD